MAVFLSQVLRPLSTLSGEAHEEALSSKPEIRNQKSEIDNHLGCHRASRLCAFALNFCRGLALSFKTDLPKGVAK
jgi:hypothetical protein